MMSFCSAAAGGFILHDLPLSVSCLSLQVWRLCKVQKASNCHQSLERNSQKSYSHDSAWASHSFIPPPPPHLPVSRSILVRLVWRSGFIPALSQWNSWFQLGPPVLGPQTLAHTHTHTLKKEWAGLLSLAPRSVEGVIESFDQNIGGAVKHPALAAVTALCLSIRLGWSDSLSA